MKFGNNDRPQITTEQQQREADQKRRLRLFLLPKHTLITEHLRVMRENGLTSLTAYRGWKRHDFVDAIMGIERAARIAAQHYGQYGAGHERCPQLDDQVQCDGTHNFYCREYGGPQSTLVPPQCRCACHLDGDVSRETSRETEGGDLEDGFGDPGRRPRRSRGAGPGIRCRDRRPQGRALLRDRGALADRH